MNVSPNLSPPISLMKPYFLMAGFFYFLSMFSLLILDPFVDIKDFSLVGWVHLYMLGFVMMGIFAAMAQLGPIVIERAHYNVNIFKYLWIVLSCGIILMMVGFFIHPIFLLYGGFFVFITMGIYAVEFLLTLKNAKRHTTITKAMKMSNIFLLIGIITGLVMAAAFNGFLNINPHSILNIHTFGLVVGFVILLIMGISLILIPMFGFATRISDNEFTNSFYTITLGVVVMICSPFILSNYLEKIAYFITLIAILLYLYQLYKMSTSRKKVVHDVWARFMYLAFFSFLLSLGALIFYLFNENELLLKVAMWLMLVGFFGSIISGNFYKIIPFLVWFHIYAPLIEEQAVPMLHELIPKRLSNLQWFYATTGLIISTIGLSIQNMQLFTGGLILLTFCASIFLLIISRILYAKY